MAYEDTDEQNHMEQDVQEKCLALPLAWTLAAMNIYRQTNGPEIDKKHFMSIKHKINKAFAMICDAKGWPEESALIKRIKGHTELTNKCVEEALPMVRELFDNPQNSQPKEKVVARILTASPLSLDAV